MTAVFPELLATDVVKPYPGQGGALDLMFNVRQ